MTLERIGFKGALGALATSKNEGSDQGPAPIIFIARYLDLYIADWVRLFTNTSVSRLIEFGYSAFLPRTIVYGPDLPSSS